MLRDHHCGIWQSIPGRDKQNIVLFHMRVNISVSSCSHCTSLYPSVPNAARSPHNSALITQHSSLSPQHSALITLHFALSTARSADTRGSRTGERKRTALAVMECGLRHMNTYFCTNQKPNCIFVRLMHEGIDAQSSCKTTGIRYRTTVPQ